MLCLHDHSSHSIRLLLLANGIIFGIHNLIKSFINHTYTGQFTVPVKCLVEPHHSRLIRQPYEPHIKGLKEEMRLNPTCDVAPIVAQVLLREGQKFDEAHPEAFKYEALGGNHTRIALTQLLEEDKELASLPYYRARLVSIYAWLSTEQAQHLVLRHNRATEYTNKLTTQDQVSMHTAANYI